MECALSTRHVPCTNGRGCVSLYNCISVSMPHLLSFALYTLSLPLATLLAVSASFGSLPSASSASSAGCIGSVGSDSLSFGHSVPCSLWFAPLALLALLCAHLALWLCCLLFSLHAVVCSWHSGALELNNPSHCADLRANLELNFEQLASGTPHS